MDYKVPNVVKEYVASLSDEEIKFLFMRLEQSFDGDVAEALSIIQVHEGMDNWLKTAEHREAFYKLLDTLSQQLEFEAKRRGR